MTDSFPDFERLGGLDAAAPETGALRFARAGHLNRLA